MDLQAANDKIAECSAFSAKELDALIKNPQNTPYYSLLIAAKAVKLRRRVKAFKVYLALFWGFSIFVGLWSALLLYLFDGFLTPLEDGMGVAMGFYFLALVFVALFYADDPKEIQNPALKPRGYAQNPFSTRG
jgi:hypothetical protein